ncbi:dynein light intermediate chain-domain-containing protein [Thelonectria olida]|uniref:Dynein light intermediate chain-domain-containing protein n=1 Tax=Thelonectria olida TaxID=1576542 RepID=A0A9P8W1P7_9HYPO|nr:dynein light intermediate chain-domain-containing protein [Thelonectria olida]
MTANTNRVSIYTTGSGDADARNGDQKKDLWTSMLESVASGKRLPEKNLIVLGGTPESQRDFLESLSSPESRRNADRSKIPPLANNFALGYTYYDVLDADQDDTLARVSLYLLSQPSAEFASLVAPLLTPDTIPNTALILLLDWSQPHQWLRQMWTWIQLLQEVLKKVDSEQHELMEEVMSAWKERGRGGAAINLDGTPSATATSGDGDSSLPLGPGEWEEPLGLPLCVVCQNAQKIEFLEKSQGWKEPDFDTVLQYLRTVLLRHGASLIYTSQNTPSQLPSLIHSTLGITSLLKRSPLKHNVIDRDKIVVPPNWDSWGKIRVLSGNFDAEMVSNAWAEDINSSPEDLAPKQSDEEDDEEDQHEQREPSRNSAIARYEEWCRDPNSGGLAVVEKAMHGDKWITIDSDDTQAFLERQLKILEAFKAKVPDKAPESAIRPIKHLEFGEEKSVSEHIGPVQFNMGGIQVDADDMLKRLKDRNAYSAPSEEEVESTDNNSTGTMGQELDNDQLQSFFSGLLVRKGGADSSRS